MDEVLINESEGTPTTRTIGRQILIHIYQKASIKVEFGIILSKRSSNQLPQLKLPQINRSPRAEVVRWIVNCGLDIVSYFVPVDSIHHW